MTTTTTPTARFEIVAADPTTSTVEGDGFGSFDSILRAAGTLRGLPTWDDGCVWAIFDHSTGRLFLDEAPEVEDDEPGFSGHDTWDEVRGR